MDARGSQCRAGADEGAQRRGADDESEEAVPEQHALRPVVGDVPRIPLEHVGVLRFPEVVEDVPELHGPEPHEIRTVRIAFLVGEGVVLAMHRHPLPRGQAGRQPEGKPEQPRDRRMQRQRAMRCGAMQVDGRPETAT